MKSKNGTTADTRTRGYCVIPADRPDMVTEIVERLNAEGISFLMEDMDVIAVRQLFCAEGIHDSNNNGQLLDNVPVVFTPGTRITWPNPEACDVPA